MSAKSIKLILVVCLLLGILLCVLGCISVMRGMNLKGNPNSVSVRGLTITMALDQREEFFTQMRKFADKHSLEFKLNLYSSDNTRFLVAMYGDGFHITASNMPNAPQEIAIGFFNDASTPTPEETVYELFADLKSFINEIPNVMMTELRKSLTITIDESQREELFTRLRKLADKHSLEFTLSLSSDKTLYRVEIYGHGFHITSDSRSNPRGEIIIAFFLDYYKTPTVTSQKAVDELLDELKGLLSEIPNVTITEE